MAQAAVRADPAPTFIRALLTAQREGRSGAYDVTGDGLTTRLHFEAGKLVFADKGGTGDSLGRVLMRMGRLKLEEYAAILRAMTARARERESILFGEAAIKGGTLTPDDVRDGLGEQVRERVIHCLMLERPKWTFDERQELATTLGKQSLSVEEMTLAATKRFDPDRLARSFDPLRGHRPRLLDNPAAVAQRFGLNGGEQRFIELLNGSFTTEDCLAHGRAGPTSEAIISALVATGCVEVAAGTEPPGSKAPLRALFAESHVDATAPPLEHPSMAPKALARSDDAGPDTDPNPVPSTPSTLRIATPLEPLPVQAPPPQAARLMAEDAFLSGRSRLRKDMSAEAIPYLRRAVDLCPELAEYRLCLRWAEWLTLERDDKQQREARAELWRLATVSIREQPGPAFGYYVLGQFARAKGETERATKLFRHALRLDDDIVDAARQIRLLASGAKVDSTLVSALSSVPPTSGPRAKAPPPLPADGVGAPTPAETASSAEPAAQKPDGAPPKPAPPTSIAHGTASPARSRFLPAVLAVAALSAALGWWLERPDDTEPAPVTAPSALPSIVPAPAPPPPSVSAAIPPLATSVEAPMPSPVPSASASPPPSTISPPSAAPASSAAAPAPTLKPTPTTGILHAGPNARPHRIFVDDQLIGTGEQPLRVPCGSHLIKVGGEGREQPIDIPCGGSVTVNP